MSQINIYSYVAKYSDNLFYILRFYTNNFIKSHMTDSYCMVNVIVLTNLTVLKVYSYTALSLVLNV